MCQSLRIRLSKQRSKKSIGCQACQGHMRGKGGWTLAKGSRTSSGNRWNIPEISHNSCRFFPTFTKVTEIQVYHIRLKFANKSCQRGHVPSIARVGILQCVGNTKLLTKSQQTNCKSKELIPSKNFLSVVSTECREAPQVIIVTERSRANSVVFTSLREASARHTKPNKIDTTRLQPMNQSVFNINIQNIVRRKQTDVNGITLQPKLLQSTTNSSCTSKNL